MKFLKIALYSTAAFLISFVIITNLSREPFKVKIAINVLRYQTPLLPMYYYIAGTFFLGLAIGLYVAIYNYFSQGKKISQKKKLIKELEKKNAQLTELLQETDGELNMIKGQNGLYDTSLDPSGIILEPGNSLGYHPNGNHPMLPNDHPFFQDDDED